MTTVRKMLLVAAVLVGLARADAQAQVTQIIAFGDSFSDAGNWAAVYPAAWANYGNPLHAYYSNGHASNGAVWVEYLPKYLNPGHLAVPFPSMTGNPAGNIYSDYAWIGADSGYGTGSAGEWNLQTQVDDFLTRGQRTLDPTQLVTILIGGNDFSTVLASQGLGAPDAAWISAQETILANIETAIRKLANVGGRQFMLLKLFPLGNLPLVERPAEVPAEGRARLNQVAQRYNAALDARVAQFAGSGIRVYVLDTYGIFEYVRTHPADFGFTNVTDPLIYSTNPLGAGYMWWDGLHPTTAMHGILAYNAAIRWTTP